MAKVTEYEKRRTSCVRKSSKDSKQEESLERRGVVDTSRSSLCEKLTRAVINS